VGHIVKLANPILKVTVRDANWVLTPEQETLTRQNAKLSYAVSRKENWILARIVQA